jgi:hypothetical protein
MIKIQNIKNMEDIMRTIMEKKYANFIGYSDVRPFEILSQTNKTISIREMDAKLQNKEELMAGFVSGGFVGTFTNQSDQKWIITSNPTNPIIKAYLRKDGQYHSAKGRHVLSEVPINFYDYNF